MRRQHGGKLVINHLCHSVLLLVFCLSPWMPPVLPSSARNGKFYEIEHQSKILEHSDIKWKKFIWYGTMMNVMNRNGVPVRSSPFRALCYLQCFLSFFSRVHLLCFYFFHLYLHLLSFVLISMLLYYFRDDLIYLPATWLSLIRLLCDLG